MNAPCQVLESSENKIWTVMCFRTYCLQSQEFKMFQYINGSEMETDFNE